MKQFFIIWCRNILVGLGALAWLYAAWAIGLMYGMPAFVVFAVVSLATFFTIIERGASE